MGYQILLICVLAFVPTILGRGTIILGHDTTMGTIVIDGTKTIAETDENFVCLTLDIWPHDECRWSKLCVWDGHASMLNLVRIYMFIRKKNTINSILLINFFFFIVPGFNSSYP